MNFEALDGTKLTLLMIAGAVFASVGLYLMVRPKDGDAAKIEIFGLKFESSSAGLLVFLVGAGFMSLPLFVQEEEMATKAETPTERIAQVSPTQRALVTQGDVTAEVEPNDDQSGPNELLLGQRVKGKVIKGEPDWYVMLVPEEGVSNHQIMLKHMDGYEVRVEVYNAREEHKGWIKTVNGAKYLDITSDFSDRMFFKVHSINTSGDTFYELAVLPES